MHWDCKGHAGAMLTFGEGAVSSYSRKVKLNTCSSTETELVGGDMYMPEMLWSLYFMQSQGYNVEIIELYQDNKSTELLMTNGRFSSGKRTKHIKAKFFFIKDRIDDDEIRVVHCPTKEMWPDMLTKPLQGTAFREMRAKHWSSAWENDQARSHPATAGVCWGILNWLESQATDRRLVGKARVQTRLTNQQKGRNLTGCQ
jgi:hypothetical protein